MKDSENITAPSATYGCLSKKSHFTVNIATCAVSAAVRITYIVMDVTCVSAKMHLRVMSV